MTATTQTSNYVPSAEEFLEANSDVPKWGRHYNCWGFVAGFYHWTTGFNWIDEEEIERYLSDHCTEFFDFNDLQPGDVIAAYNEDGVITHTMLFKGGGEHSITHKPGTCSLETISWDVYRSWYPYYGTAYRYWRPNLS